LRHPVYALSDVVVLSRDVAHDRVVQDVMEALDLHLNGPVPLSLAPQGIAAQ